MPWKRMDVSEQRMRFVIRAVSGGERLGALCREFGISRPTGYLWRGRNQQAGSLTSLAEKSRRPRHSPGRTAKWMEQRVVELRQQTGWGAKKLRVLLAQEQRVDLPVRTIHRILERHGLVSEGVHGPAPQRFERSAPNELWQMDGKGKYPLSDGECHPLSIVDDHSRYAVGLYALSATLERWARRPKTAQRLALRSRMVLACAEGRPNRAVATRLHVSSNSVCKWRERFRVRRLGRADR